MRKLWMTLLLLSICLITLVPPMHVRGDENETTTTTETSTITTSTTASSTATSTLSGSTDSFIIKVEPQVQTVHRNGKIRSATYSVEVRALTKLRDEVELSISGLPKSSQAVFNPDEGVPRPVFVSILKIFISSSTPAGVYTLTIIGAREDAEQHATTTLIVEGQTVTTTTTTTTATHERRLRLSVSTGQENYKKGDRVDIFGYVKLRSGESVANIPLSLDVVDSTGQDVHVRSLVTDQAGRYSDSFTLPLNAVEGTYAVYVVANMATYENSFAKTTFTVGVSDMPSIRIVNATVAMVNGTISSEFHPGETVVVWVAVNNSGADLKDGRVWVEVLDPNDVPISVVVVMVTIHNGEQVKTGIQVTLRSDAATGTYTVRALVSNAPIMTGGRFLDFKETAFIVT
jgi:hypothetical protein